MGPARPQQTKEQRAPLRYVENLSDASTPLADTFSILSDSFHLRSGYAGDDQWQSGRDRRRHGPRPLKAKSIEPQMVAVEVNDTMLERTHLDTTQLKDGDHVEFLFYMGGGR